jgi:Spy/CpxP family protein refolding chaperone
MMPSLSHRVLAVIFVLMVSEAVSAQPSRWWKTDPAKSELGLTADQTAKIEGIFEEAIAQLRQQKNDLDRLEDQLSRLIEASADEVQVTQQIDRVETVRATLNKTRTLMLLHMRQVLTADQRLRLNAMHDRLERQQRDRGRSRVPSGGGDRPDDASKRPN